MSKTLAAEDSLNPSLLALKPRQVLISRLDMGKEIKASQKVLLLRSIAHYLDRCGFSKCFKKFISEAGIEKKELNSSLPDLEEIYCEFLKKSHLEAVEVKDESGNADENASNVHETEKKDKKKKNKEVAANGITEGTAVEGVGNLKTEKKKKKKKKETKLEVTEEEKVNETDAEIEDGLKKKKKNKTKSIEVESLGDDEKEKVSKKRKRSEPEETKEHTKDDDEESKRRKKEENVAEDEEVIQETPVKQMQENGNVEKSGTKSTNQKSGKGLSNSKEPKKPFQRVNVEEVVFTDDRLKDNSYWAKGGADSGYGAKAQEVLGQVRGRGFRHEKTKKKRGSYRGGEIDLESHSVKFDYSDEE